MPHADHFLSRLDRLNTSEVDVALQLYRDPELLRAIMQAAKVPEAVPRIAVSLDDPALGPFIVVTRDGHFVTCLGRGMSPTGLLVITRGQLDAYAERMESLRERLKLAIRLTGHRERPCTHLMRRLVVNADAVSREEFLAISAWEPMLSTIFLDLYLGLNQEILDVTPRLCTIRRPKGKAVELALREYWDMVHAASHFLLLGTMGGEGEYFQRITEGHPAARSALSWALTSTSMIPFITRGAWAVGRMGKQLLPVYKRALFEDVAFYEFLDTVLALIAIGRRHSGLRAEISKALHAAPTNGHNQHAEKLRQRMRQEVEMVCEMARQMLDCSSEKLDASRLSMGRAMFDVTEEELPDEVLRDVVRVAPLNCYLDGLSDGEKIIHSATLVAATARDAPESFYFPREVVRARRWKWTPEFTLKLLAPRRQLQKVTNAPARREQRPGRNQACSCGSGAKYKKCCGAA